MQRLARETRQSENCVANVPSRVSGFSSSGIVVMVITSSSLLRRVNHVAETKLSYGGVSSRKIGK